MHILVVEDEIKLAELIAKGLAECSYTTSLVSTCKEASNAISESTFDAIVLDLGVPDGGRGALCAHGGGVQGGSAAT
jgi:DNA-binding response OmpR family regulator